MWYFCCNICLNVELLIFVHAVDYAGLRCVLARIKRVQLHRIVS